MATVKTTTSYDPSAAATADRASRRSSPTSRAIQSPALSPWFLAADSTRANPESLSPSTPELPRNLCRRQHACLTGFAGAGSTNAASDFSTVGSTHAASDPPPATDSVLKAHWMPNCGAKRRAWKPVPRSVRGSRPRALSCPSPEVVFYNVGTSTSVPVVAAQAGVALLSCYSKNLLRLFLEVDGELTPSVVMADAISGPEYDSLQLLD